MPESRHEFLERRPDEDQALRASWLAEPVQVPADLSGDLLRERHGALASLRLGCVEAPQQGTPNGGKRSKSGFKEFIGTLPGLLTGIAALITAIAGAFFGGTQFAGQPQGRPTVFVTVTAQASPAPTGTATGSPVPAGRRSRP